MTTQISAETLSLITHNQIPVITTELLAQLYGTEPVRIRQGYSRNSERFIEGKHYFKLTGSILKSFKNEVSLSDFVKIAPTTNHLLLWTERGAARHAKMLETDQAWEVFEKLEDCYFAKSTSAPAPQPSFIPQRFMLTLSEGKWFAEPAPLDGFIATPETLAQRIKAESFLFDRASLMQVMQTCLALI